MNLLLIISIKILFSSPKVISKILKCIIYTVRFFSPCREHHDHSYIEDYMVSGPLWRAFRGLTNNNKLPSPSPGYLSISLALSLNRSLFLGQVLFLSDPILIPILIQSGHISLKAQMCIKSGNEN